MNTALKCPDCGAESAPTTTRFRCECGEPLDVRIPAAPVSRELFDSRVGRARAPHDSGVWRFKELVHPELPNESVVSRPEGNTPLFHSGAVGAWAGCESLRLKHEGYNPTGSFKDRGMTVAISQGHAAGARAFVCASTGNTSAAVASYAALCGKKAVILVPEKATALGKMSQALAYGATTVKVRGNFDDAMRMVQQGAEDLGLYLLNSLNPFRLQGQKTIVLEAMQQLGWDAPDWFVFPAGNLGNTSAFGLALMEAYELGLIDHLPKMLAVQAAGAAPFAHAYTKRFEALVPVKPETIATAIRIGDPVSYNRAVRSIRGTYGMVTAVTDAEILEAKAVVDGFGIGAEPASCASVAGVRKATKAGIIQPNHRVVAVLTGHLLKDPDVTLQYHTGQLGGDRANPPVTIDPTLEALEAVLGGAK